MVDVVHKSLNPATVEGINKLYSMFVIYTIKNWFHCYSVQFNKGYYKLWIHAGQESGPMC